MATILGYFKDYFTKLIHRSDNSVTELPDNKHVELYIKDDKLMVIDSKNKIKELGDFNTK